MVRNASLNVVGISDKNPHYLKYKEKEVLLITSAEHYGAMINKNFDFIQYFDKLAAYGLNYTRIYPGAFVEYAGKWMPEDNMAPGPDLIAPWARSEIPGYYGGGNKFDLNRWDCEYFDRLHRFLTEADKRGIVVEICFFNCMYDDFWVYSPLHKDANVQGVGDCGFNTFQTLDNEALAIEQQKYIEKLIIETNEFDNVIYEFVDEPTLYLAKSQKVYKWISKLIETAVETENKLLKKHMLAQQLELGINFCDDDRVSLIVTQYILMGGRQVGGTPALNNCYCFDKPIEDNETYYMAPYPWPSGDRVSISRLEAWEFMVGGGAAFNQLNGYFSVKNPSGEDETNHAVLQGLQNLRAFLESFRYIEMTRDNDTVRKISIGAQVNSISKKGEQYAIYMHHSFPNLGGWRGAYYEPNFGKYTPKITLNLGKGEYKVSFIEPATLGTINKYDVVHNGGDIDIQCPLYNLDIAIKIINMNS